MVEGHETKPVCVEEPIYTLATFLGRWFGTGCQEGWAR
jgi:hypothetical protein